MAWRIPSSSSMTATNVDTGGMLARPADRAN
jgi:hypothetical protein